MCLLFVMLVTVLLYVSRIATDLVLIVYNIIIVLSRFAAVFDTHRRCSSIFQHIFRYLICVTYNLQEIQVSYILK